MALALLGGSVFAAVAAAASSPDDKFAAWRHVHNKVYLTSAEEAAARRNFAVNDALVQQHSTALPYALGHNAYSDQDLASLASRRNGFVASAKLKEVVLKTRNARGNPMKIHVGAHATLQG